MKQPVSQKIKNVWAFIHVAVRALYYILHGKKKKSYLCELDDIEKSTKNK